MNRNTKWLLAPLFTGAILLLLFSPGCEQKMPHEEGYVPMTKTVELKKVGRCKDEPGNLMRVDYVGWNTLMFYSKFIQFVDSNMSTFCIPDLDENKRSLLSNAEQEKLEVGYFNSLARGTEAVKDAEGNVSYQNVALRRLQEMVRMGSELAYIDLHLHDYKDTNRAFQYSEDNPAYQKLKQLAQSGNAEAMCLFSRRIPTPFEGYEHLKINKQEALNDKDYMRKLLFKKIEEGPEDKWTKGIINAAKAGASDCMYLYGSGLVEGKPYYTSSLDPEKDKQEGWAYLFKAAEKGNASVAGSLASSYLVGSRMKNFVEYDLGKYQCWAQIYNQSFPAPYKPILVEQKIKQKRSSEKFHGRTLNFTQYDPQTLCQTIKE